MNKTTYTFIFFLLSLVRANSQTINDSTKKTDGEYCLSLKMAYHQQKTAYAEVGLFLGIETHLSSWGGGTMYGPSISTEFLLQSQENKSNIIAPKIGFESYNANVIGLPWGARCNLVCYTNGKENSLKLAPEVGLSIWAFVNVFYGYNFPLTNSSLVDNNGHKLTVMVNIPLYWKKYFKHK